MRALPTDFYGDNVRWFLGRVVDTTPPVGSEGCVRVRIYGVHSPDVNDIPQRDLPWAQVMIPGSEGGSSGIGRGPGIVAGSMVFGMFLDGFASQIPIVMGSLPHIQQPTAVQAAQVQQARRLFNTSDIPAEPTADEDSDEFKQTTCIKFFIDNGYSVKQACAITGCIGAVSGFTTFEQTTNQSAPQGLLQWSARENRLQGLQKFAVQFEPTQNWKTFEVQLLWILRELRTTQLVANTALVRTTKIEDGNGACSIFLRYYVKQGSSKLGESVALAESLFNNLANGA